MKMQVAQVSEDGGMYQLQEKKKVQELIMGLFYGLGFFCCFLTKHLSFKILNLKLRIKAQHHVSFFRSLTGMNG